jgi:putative transposase
MPRRARVLLPAVALHLIQRGNNRSACFYADEDYQLYLALLAELAQKHDCAVHGWCLLTSHEHLCKPYKKGQKLDAVLAFLEE